VTPGFGHSGSAVGDQSALQRPRSDRLRRPDYLVVCRPITEAGDPTSAAQANRRRDRAARACPKSGPRFSDQYHAKNKIREQLYAKGLLDRPTSMSSNLEGYNPTWRIIRRSSRSSSANSIVRGGQEFECRRQYRSRHVVIEFPDYATALPCYNSPEYQANIKIPSAFGLRHRDHRGLDAAQSRRHPAIPRRNAEFSDVNMRLTWPAPAAHGAHIDHGDRPRLAG